MKDTTGSIKGTDDCITKAADMNEHDTFMSLAKQVMVEFDRIDVIFAEITAGRDL